MQVTETLSDGLKRGFTVVVPAADIESRRTSRLTDLSKNVQVPGFRPGRVPLPVVRQRFGKAVAAEVLDESVNEATRQVLEERGLRPALQPKVDLTDPAIGPGPARDLEFKVEVEVMPDITLPDFSGISLTRLKSDVTPETVEERLQQMAQRNSELRDIPAEELGDRGAAKGEVLVVDFTGKVDDQPFEGGAATDFEIEVAGDGFIAGFTEQLEGMKPGESRTIQVAFPEDYFKEDLAGKPATFDVTAKRLGRRHIPELDDAFAQKLAFDSMDELRDFIKRRVQQEYDSLSRLRLKRELLDALAERATFAAPEGIVEQEFSGIWQRLQADRERGALDDDDKAKDEETLRADYRAIAERRVRLGLLMAEIGQANNIVVTPDELTRALRMEVSRYPGHETEMMELFRKYPQMSEGARGQVLEEKVVDYVLELAQVTDQMVPPEELSQDVPIALPSTQKVAAAANETPAEPSGEAAAEPASE